MQEFSGIRYPNWQVSVEAATRLYPAGIVAAGLAVRLADNTDEKERDKQLKEFVTALLRDTDLKVMTCHYYRDCFSVFTEG